jgi:hypothetical protein
MTLFAKSVMLANLQFNFIPRRAFFMSWKVSTGLGSMLVFSANWFFYTYWRIVVSIWGEREMSSVPLLIDNLDSHIDG